MNGPPALVARLATAALAAGLLVGTGAVGRLLVVVQLVPVVGARPPEVTSPLPWRPEPDPDVSRHRTVRTDVGVETPTGHRAAVRQPVLAIFGADDWTVPVADAATLSLGGDGPRSVRIAAGLGHGLDRSGAPDPGVAATVARWLADPASQPPGVRGAAPAAAGPTVRLPDVPAWHLGLLALATLVALAGGGVGRRLPAGDGAGDGAADRLRGAALGAAAAQHVGLPVLAGLGMAHAGPVTALPWVGLKAAAMWLAWRGADAVVRAGERPRCW